MDTPDTPPVADIADTRTLSLGQLASQGAAAAAKPLRHVLPSDGKGRIAVAAFGSSI